MILKALKLKTLGVGVVNIQASKCNACSPICSATPGAPLDGGRGDESDESGADSDSRQQTAPWAADSQGWN